MIFFLNDLFQYEIIYIDLFMKKTFETQKTILKTCIKFEIPNTTLRFRLFRFFLMSVKNFVLNFSINGAVMAY